MKPTVTEDLWMYLARTEKTVVMYGMGNGADKILDACRQKGISVADFFASDGFVRGHCFHGKQVLTWSQIKERYGAENVTVLLSFGTSRPEVLENIDRIASEAELYAPDVPAFGDGLFDLEFAKANREELAEAYSLLSDEESRKIYENTVLFKLTGRLDYLKAAVSDPERIWERLICPKNIRTAADLGAYNGDTARELIERAEGSINTVYAMEPDARNYKKLAAYAEGETRARVLPYRLGAWSRRETLLFDGSGNRNASFGTNRSATLENRPAALREVEADALDHITVGQRVDYIKYDVEGSEAEALQGSLQTVAAHSPTLLVSLYHRNEDIFALPLLVHKLFPAYQGFYMRRLAGVPAWDLNLYCKKDVILE